MEETKKGENQMNETEQNETSCSCSTNECDCGKPSGRKMPKMIICLAVLLAVVGIVAFRAVNTRNSSGSDTAGFNFGRTVLGAVTSGGSTFPAERNLGEYLGAFDELNTVAADTDTVLVYIPALGNVAVDDTTKTNVIKFQQDLKNSNITAGLYTLSCDSPDYSQIAKQAKLPIIFVANKGTGAVTIPGNNVNEYMLYQAFQACCDPSPGCCP